MRMMISGGGTGGHIYPALALIEYISKAEPGSEFIYVGSLRGLENQLVVNANMQNVAFESLEVSGFRRSISIENVRTVVRFVRAVSRSRKLIREFKPDVVVGTGGYVCAPLVYAAARAGIPTVIHEQNAIAGLTNKFLSRYTSAVALSFRGTERKFPAARRAVYTGNPRASQVQSGNAVAARKKYAIPDGKKLVLVIGGSRGALAINDAIRGWIPIISDPSIHVLVVSGERYYKAWMDAAVNLTGAQVGEGRIDWNEQVTIVPYVYDMPDLLAATYLAIGRAGASSIAEWTVLGVPVILIPSPNVTANHQEENAKSLVKAKAATMIIERDLTAEKLHHQVMAIINNESVRESMGAAAKSIGQADAAKRLYDIVKEVMGVTKSGKRIR